MPTAHSLQKFRMLLGTPLYSKDSPSIRLSSYSNTDCKALYLYICSCLKAHKALTFSFHLLRFAAKALTVVHDCHPATRLSSSTILLHVVFGRPGLLLPSGLHSNAVTQCSSLFFLIICPIQFHLRRLI